MPSGPAPVWGQLPPPPQGRQRRSRDRPQVNGWGNHLAAVGDYDDRDDRDDDEDDRDRDRDLAGDYAPDKRHRISSLTAHTAISTDAPTESSTLSPLLPPTPSTFAPTGLAPRPPSLSARQVSASAAADAPSSPKRARRRSHPQQQKQQQPDALAPAAINEVPLLTPPAAPDVPRAPPISYRSPYASPRASPYTSPKPFPAGPFRPPRQTPTPPTTMTTTATMMPIETRTPDDFYIEAAMARRQHTVPIRDDPRTARQGPAVAAAAYNANPPREAPPESNHSRNSSVSGPGGGGGGASGGGSRSGQAFADGRSPLQRLEQKLGVLTKEEKRAQVEAAENKVRERAERKARENTGQQQLAERSPNQGQDEIAARGMEQDLEESHAKGRPGRREEREAEGARTSGAARGGPRVGTAAQPQMAMLVDTTRPRPSAEQYQPEEGLARSQPRQGAARRRAERAERPASERIDPPDEQPEPKQKQQQPLSPTDGIPKRNLSFRERAANSKRRDLPAVPTNNNSSSNNNDSSSNNMVINNNDGGEDSSNSITPPFAVPVRTSSNKLRKDPPAGYYDRRPQVQTGAPTTAHVIRPDAYPTQQPQQQNQQHQQQHQRQQSLPPPIDVATSPVVAQRPVVVPGPASREQMTWPRSARKHATAEPATNTAEGDPRDGNGGGAYMTGAAGNGPVHLRWTSIGEPSSQPPGGSDGLTDGQKGEHDARLSRLIYDKEQQQQQQPQPQKRQQQQQQQPRQQPLAGPPDEGVYHRPHYLAEWKTATVGNLSGPLLDLTAEEPDRDRDRYRDGDWDRPWWDGTNSRQQQQQPQTHQHQQQQQRRRSSISSRAWKAEAFDGEYDDGIIPTRFKPALYLECGPLLRYCGIRHEKISTSASGSRASKPAPALERHVWRGTVMIVTRDSDSDYDITPTLRLFVQPIELLPPPPAEIRGEEDLPAEYVDPIAGHPKLGRRGETLYVRPVEHLEEGRDLSWDETDEGLYERTRTAPDVPLGDGLTELPGSFAGRRKRIAVDGESTSKFRDVRGFRLHAERGLTWWRFNIEIGLRDRHQQRIAYRINRGPSMGFWVPPRDRSMNMMFYSGNGSGARVSRSGGAAAAATATVDDAFCGPDPMWRDVLNTHQTQPFHLMVGGGDQICADAVMARCPRFRQWINIRDDAERLAAPLSPGLQDELERFYLDRYCAGMSRGLFSLVGSQIPAVNMWEDGDIFAGYGSYPDREMAAPVFAGLGAVAFKYYMLFQHQSSPDEPEAAEPSWITGHRPGPYIHERSRSVFVSLGTRISLLAVDCRTERDELDVVREETWQRIMNRCYGEIIRGRTRHLLVVLGIPVAYPRLVWLENSVSSRLMDPIKALGRSTGMFGKTLDRLSGGAEVLDNLNDNWTAKHHREERSIIIKDLRDLAAIKSIRVTILSGDVRLSAVGQFYSSPRLRIPKHEDHRYIPNVISSAIANAPPPDELADVLGRRGGKVHRFDPDTDEDMIPLFTHGVDGVPRSSHNSRLLPHRNWCSIREWIPGSTPPPSRPESPREEEATTPSSTPGLLRRISSRKRPQGYRSETILDSKPPPSGGGGAGGLFRSLSSRRNSLDGGKITRSGSLGRAAGSLFGRRGRKKQKPDNRGINGQWGGAEEEGDDDGYGDPSDPRAPRNVLRNADQEYETGDESHFTARPRTAPGDNDINNYNNNNSPTYINSRAPSFRRTPTSLEEAATTSGRRPDRRLDVDLEGGLDICINAEVCRTDPAGITVPYRLLVPRLVFKYEESEEYTIVHGQGGERGYQNEDVDEEAHDSHTAEDLARVQTTSGGGGAGDKQKGSLRGFSLRRRRPVVG